MTTTTPSSQAGNRARIDLRPLGSSPATGPVPTIDTVAIAPTPEAVARVTATAADLISQGRRVTMRELTRLTGLESMTVVASVDSLVTEGVLQPAGAAPHHYLFARGRWPYVWAPRT